jgi:hypothetical protein
VEIAAGIAGTTVSKHTIINFITKEADHQWICLFLFNPGIVIKKFQYAGETWVAGRFRKESTGYTSRIIHSRWLPARFASGLSTKRTMKLQSPVTRKVDKGWVSFAILEESRIVSGAKRSPGHTIDRWDERNTKRILPNPIASKKKSDLSTKG